MLLNGLDILVEVAFMKHVAKKFDQENWGKQQQQQGKSTHLPNKN